MEMSGRWWDGSGGVSIVRARRFERMKGHLSETSREHEVVEHAYSPRPLQHYRGADEAARITHKHRTR